MCEEDEEEAPSWQWWAWLLFQTQSKIPRARRAVNHFREMVNARYVHSTIHVQKCFSSSSLPVFEDRHQREKIKWALLFDRVSYGSCSSWVRSDTVFRSNWIFGFASQSSKFVQILGNGWLSRPELAWFDLQILFLLLPFWKRSFTEMFFPTLAQKIFHYIWGDAI